MVKPAEFSRVRLVACDIDGTLLPEGERVLSPRLFELIRRLADRGIRFTTASGRQYACQRRLFAQVPEDIFYICENGAAVFRGIEEISSVSLDREEAIRMAEYMDSMDQCEALVSGPRFCYLMENRRDFFSLIRDQVGNDTVQVSRWEDVPEEIIKVTAFCRDGGERHLSALESRWGGEYNVALSGAKWVDITRASKADGLRKVCGVLSISPCEVMAFGDNYNDTAILEAAGYPVAMSHSPERVRALAVKICQGRVEDELAWLLEELERGVDL